MQYMHVFQVYTCIYRQWKGGTHVSICQYMPVYMSKIHAYTSVRICTYIQQYFCMYFQQYICQYFCMYIQQYFFFSCISRSRCRHSCFAFAGAGARSLHLRRAVATASLSRGCASADRSPNSIRSGLRDLTAAASGNLYRRALTAR